MALLDRGLSYALGSAQSTSRGTHSMAAGRVLQHEYTALTVVVEGTHGMYAWYMYCMA